MKSSNVDRVFHEKTGGNVALNEMANYARSGDIIFVYSIASLGKNIKSTIRFIMQTQENNVTLFIKREKFDSASQLGKHILTILSALDEVNGKTGMMERADAPKDRGRMPRELSDLRTYMKLVEKGETSVTEACQKLNIGRTTYYRRCKQLEDMVTEGVEDAEDDTV